jgi:hypothetical protein
MKDMRKKDAKITKPKVSRNAVAKDLARRHFELEGGITRIFRVHAAGGESAASEPIVLLEVNENTVPAGILPLQFGPTDLVPYSSVIIDVTPEEFEMLKTKELALPDGWTIGLEYRRLAQPVRSHLNGD